MAVSLAERGLAVYENKFLGFYAFDRSSRRRKVNYTNLLSFVLVTTITMSRVLGLTGGRSGLAWPGLKSTITTTQQLVRRQ